MIDRFKAFTKEREDGFTLIEILVVILIIGILAAIAIPVFLNQRKTANDAQMKSDVQNLAKVIETYGVNNPKLVNIDMTYVYANAKKNPDTKIAVFGVKDDYCIIGMHMNGNKYLAGRTWAENGNIRPYYLYVSKGGGEDRGNSSYSTMSCDTYGTSYSWN